MYRRRRRKTPFAQIPNAMLQNPDMGPGAVALVCYLLSHSRDWEGRANDIEARFGVGEKYRRHWTKNAERCGWLRARRVRQKDGTLKSFYEANDDDFPLPPELRTTSENWDSVPITPWSEWVREGFEGDEDMPQTTPPAGGGGPPPSAGVVAPGVVAPGVVAEGDILKKELPKKEVLKKEGEEPPLQKWERYRKAFGYDVLVDFPECVRNAAFELAEYQLTQDKPGCVPHNVPTFLTLAEGWAKGLAFHGKGHPAVVEGLLRRAMSYLAQDRTMRNYALPVWKMMDEVGIGEKSNGRPTVPLAPPKNPETVQAELFQQRVIACAESVKAELRARPKGGLAEAANLQSQYPLDVRTAALQRVMGDQAFNAEWDELKRNGRTRLKPDCRS